MLKRSLLLCIFSLLILVFGCLRPEDNPVPEPAPDPLPVSENGMPNEPTKINTESKSLFSIPSGHYEYLVAPSQPPADFKPDSRVECFGNFHTMGIIVEIPKPTPTNGALVNCWLNINSTWQPMHRLSHIGGTRNFVGSIFWLKPDTEYQVKVEITGIKDSGHYIWYGKGKTRQEPVLPAAAQELFVSPAGNDADPGTKDQPLKTVAKAVELIKPGMAIVLRTGEYCEGDFSLPDTRESGQPITVKAYPGDKPVFNNADPEYADPAEWNDEGNGIISRPFKGHCGMAAVIDRKTGTFTRLLRVPYLEDLKNRFYQKHKPFNECGINGAYHINQERIYIILPEPAGDYEIVVPKYTRAFDIYENGNLNFDGITFKYYGRGMYNSALFFQNTSDVLVQNCRFLHCNMFVWLKADCSRVTVQDNYYYDRFGDWSFSLLKGTHQGYHGEIEGGAVGTDANYSGRGLVFRGNMVDGLFDGVHLCPFRIDEAITNETDVYNNIIINIFDDHIETDGFSRNVRIFDNYMRVSLSGISLAQALDGPTFILYNVIADQGLVNGSLVDGFEGYPFKTNGGSGAKVGSGEVFFYHNTATTSEPESNAMLIKHARWRRLTFRNNVWTGNGKGFVSWRKNLSPMDWDYDNLYVKNGPAAIIAYKTIYKTLDDLRTARGWLEHGLNADPLFTDEAQGKYELKDGSPNIDAGIIVPGINDGRYQGDAPDIGAFEKR